MSTEAVRAANPSAWRSYHASVGLGAHGSGPRGSSARHS